MLKVGTHTHMHAPRTYSLNLEGIAHYTMYTVMTFLITTKVVWAQSKAHGSPP